MVSIEALILERSRRRPSFGGSLVGSDTDRKSQSERARAKTITNETGAQVHGYQRHWPEIGRGPHSGNKHAPIAATVGLDMAAAYVSYV